MSNKYKAAYTLLYEAELEQCAAKYRLQHKRHEAERALHPITDFKACDLGRLHKAEASVQWWGRVITTVTKLLEEQQNRNVTRPRLYY